MRTVFSDPALLTQIPSTNAVFSPCSAITIWNGTRCIPIYSNSGTTIVGLETPIASRAELDEIERNFVRRNYVNIPEVLFNPDTELKGKQIQDIRQSNLKQIGTDFERTWEIVINKAAYDKLYFNRTTLGADPIQLLLKHAQAENVILANSLPKINRQVVLKRIMVVDPAVVNHASGGWTVVNDRTFGFWANDKLNNIKGFIPYDIDSRWTFDDTWADYFLANNQKFQGVAIDYAMLHEMTHHLPVGDNYTYNFGRGNGISIPQSSGRNAIFTWNSLSFMDNDHMSGPSAQYLTAPSSYQIQYFWQLNPKNIKAAQDSIYPVNHVYGNYYYNNLNIKITGLAGLNISGCSYYRLSDLPPNSPLVPSTEYTSIQYANNECNISLSAAQQGVAFPGAYIGLNQGSTVFPIYLPRNLMETLYWANLTQIPSNFTFTIKATPQLRNALAYYSSRILAGSGNVSMSPSKLRAYMTVTPTTAIPTQAVAFGTIDNLNNQYIFEYQFPATITPSPSPIKTPTPSPTASPTPSPIITPSPTKPTTTGCTAPSFFTVQMPAQYSYSKSCLKVPNLMYNDDNRFSIFNLPSYLTEIPFIITGNASIKESKTLNWSINLTRRSRIYILYRKIPDQSVPSWITQKFSKLTPNEFVNLPTFALRKNDQGLIGVYDIYKYPASDLASQTPGSIGTVNFGPASDGATTAYSMYIVGVEPL
ncbi:MAG: hypothetical protein M3Q44_08235 [bacterium]|nr:hypothetical protein [bacterium]